jgi:hypothetical protein
VKSIANFAEDREGHISFAPLDSSKVTPVQSTILGKAVLAKPQNLAFGLNPATQPQEFDIVIRHIGNPTYHVSLLRSDGLVFKAIDRFLIQFRLREFDLRIVAETADFAVKLTLR